jgi:hypothetical protein
MYVHTFMNLFTFNIAVLCIYSSTESGIVWKRSTVQPICKYANRCQLLCHAREQLNRRKDADLDFQSMAIAVEFKVLFRFERGPEKGLLDMGLFKAKLTFFSLKFL